MKIRVMYHVKLIRSAGSVFSAFPYETTGGAGTHRAVKKKRGEGRAAPRISDAARFTYFVIDSRTRSWGAAISRN